MCFDVHRLLTFQHEIPVIILQTNGLQHKQNTQLVEQRESRTLGGPTIGQCTTGSGEVCEEQ